MNRNTMTRLWVCAWMTMVGIHFSNGQTATLSGQGRTWEAIAAECPKGIEASRWQRIVWQLKAGGQSSDSAQECLASVQDAERLGLPSEPVLVRVEEGVAKQAGSKALQEAGRQRLQSLMAAANVMREAGYGSKDIAEGRVLKSAALALESGLSAASLQKVLSRANGGQAERMRCIIEAGESMCLSGMDESTTGQIMLDFADRNMRRTEVIRASRFAIQQHAARVDSKRIRQQLWNRNDTGGQHLGSGSPSDRAGASAGSASQKGSVGWTSPSSGGSAGGTAPVSLGPKNSTQDRGR